jgi:hypothetical protein
MRFPGSFSMIISHMPKQCSPLVIYFVTYTARQRNFWHVCCKVRLCLKTFLTVQTFYGLLCIMNSPHVCMKVRILTKFLATNFTGLRFSQVCILLCTLNVVGALKDFLQILHSYGFISTLELSSIVYIFVTL